MSNKSCCELCIWYDNCRNYNIELKEQCDEFERDLKTDEYNAQVKSRYEYYNRAVVSDDSQINFDIRAFLREMLYQIQL